MRKNPHFAQLLRLDGKGGVGQGHCTERRGAEEAVFSALFRLKFPGPPGNM
jgi:hypothetical protein